MSLREEGLRRAMRAAVARLIADGYTGEALGILRRALGYPIACRICGEGFRWPGEAESHERAAHGGEDV